MGKVKHKTNRKGADDPRPEWRFQQPGESRKEYLKRYQREYHKQEWYPGHRVERIQKQKIGVSNSRSGTQITRLRFTVRTAESGAPNVCNSITATQNRRNSMWDMDQKRSIAK